MRQKVGNLHVFINPKRGEKVHVVGDEPFDSMKSRRAGEICVVGDEEGLYRLWMAVEEALISRRGLGAAAVYSGAWKGYRVHVLRVETKSNFLKLFAK